MTTIQKALAASVVVALISGTIIYRYQRLPKTLEPAAASLKPGVSPDRATSRKTEALTEQLARTKTSKPPLDRTKELERLKLKWIEVGGSNDKLAEQDALAKESAELLMCSREMLDLLKFLTLRKMRYAETKTDCAVAELFGTSRAAEARQLLTELPETAELLGEKSYKEGGTAYRDRWSNAAGKTCPEDQFESFRAALNCKSCAIEALYGRNESLMASDPQTAFTLSLEAFKSGTPSISGRYGVTRLFDGELSPNVDFQKFEEQLPPDGPKDESFGPYGEEEAVTEIRRKLFWSWAKIDPAAAANHVLANPDRLAPKLMKAIVGGYSDKNRQGIVSWVSTFPEGPYYDAAAGSAAVYARGTPDIDELIRKIQDSKLREEAVKQARIPLANPDTR